MGKQNFFVDCHVFDGNLQGTTTYLKGLYKELIKDPDKQFFLASSDEKKLMTVFGEHPNVTYLKYQSHNKFFRLLIDIPRLIKQNNIDFAHFQYIVPPIKKCHYIVTIHDVLFLDYPKYFPLLYKIKNKLLFGWSAKKSEIVLTVSEYSKKQIQKHFEIPKVFITPNAVDPAFFETYDKDQIMKKVKEQFQMENYWIYTSRWEPRKNHETLLKVFVENGHYQNYYLAFIGDKAIPNPNYDAYYEALEDHIKVKIKVFNKVSFSDLLLLIRGARLSVYPSVAEGFGIPPLESLAARIPTLCSNTTAMSDFEFFKNCFFNPLDANDLKEKISIGLEDKQLSEKISAMQEKYTWESAAKQFNKAIEAFQGLH